MINNLIEKVIRLAGRSYVLLSIKFRELYFTTKIMVEPKNRWLEIGSLPP